MPEEHFGAILGYLCGFFLLFSWPCGLKDCSASVETLLGKEPLKEF